MRFGRVMRGTRAVFVRLEGDTLRPLTRAPWAGGVALDEVWSMSDNRLLAPCVPGKIVCVGLNYADHIAEMGEAQPADPVLFLKPPSSVIGPGDTIRWPAMAGQVDYEGELGIVIGKTAKNIEKQDAERYIFGYTCVNDVTARDLQARDGQWTRAKGFDTFCPIGPWIETELYTGDCLVQTSLNGEIVQRSSTAHMIHGIAALVSFVSRVMTLQPGDVIATGTPSGIGPMQAGDTVQITVGDIGPLTNIIG